MSACFAKHNNFVIIVHGGSEWALVTLSDLRRTLAMWRERVSGQQRERRGERETRTVASSG